MLILFSFAKKILSYLGKTILWLSFGFYILFKKVSLKNLFLFLLILALITLIFLESFSLTKEENLKNISLIKLKENKKNINQPIVKKDFDFSIASFNEKNIDLNYPTITLNGTALVSSDEILNDFSLPRTGIEIYVVQPGDTIASIAKKFGITEETIYWENKLPPKATLKPGQELRILPVSGLTHKVSPGDTLGKIALKYKASIEDIIDFNNLADPSDIFIDDILIIPFGKKPQIIKPVITPKAKPKILFVNENYQNYYEWLKNTQCHRFAYGQCTSWIAFKWATVLGRCIPWTGHAKSWLTLAKSMNFKTGTRSDGPKIGAIIVLKESGWAARRYGHVGYIESFDENTVTFSEMNFKGPWQVTIRSIPKNDPKILGYIYPN